MRNGEQKVRIPLCFSAAIDDAGRRDEVFDRQRVGRIVRPIAAGDPVNGGVEMRAGMLAEAHIVPVPGRPALVVARDFLHAKRPALAHLRRQHDRRKIRRQRLCQIDDVERRPPRRRARRSACSASGRGLRRAFVRPSPVLAPFCSRLPFWWLSSRTLADFAFERFRIIEMPRDPVLRHVTWINVLDRALECLHYRCGEPPRAKASAAFPIDPTHRRSGRERD